MSLRDAVHRRDRHGYTWFHAPGYLVTVAADRVATFERAVRSASAAGAGSPAQHPPADRDPEHAADRLRGYADAAVDRLENPPPFDPVCLTLYLGNQCNLACSYCYADPGTGWAAHLEWPQIRVAAKAVLANCGARGLPLVAVFHGGCEPTLYPDLIDRTLDGLHRLAGAAGVPLLTHVATNGVMPAPKASWLARRFDSVSLSCDGPEPVQSHQRPARGGGATTVAVERTARIVAEAGTRLEVRTTITPGTADRQAEIADYLCRRLNPDEIHWEPVYLAGRATSAAQRWQVADAAGFVAGYLRAREVGAGYGVPVRTSLARPGEAHGPYCNLDRDVLQLVPGGVVSGCFLAHDTVEAARTRTAVGLAGRAGLELDHARIATVRAGHAARPPRCRGCVNRFHCSVGCPDSCLLDPAAAIGGFRCEVAKRLTTAVLDAAAEDLWQRSGRGGTAGARLTWDGTLTDPEGSP